MGESLLLGVVCGTINLVVIVVETSDVCTRKLCNLSGGTSNTASNVQDSVAVLDPNLCGEVVLVTGNSLVETLTIGITAEVEGLSPAILVDVGGEIVVTLIN